MTAPVAFCLPVDNSSEIAFKSLRHRQPKRPLTRQTRIGGRSGPAQNSTVFVTLSLDVLSSG